jgi:hypothetical protein
MLLYWIGRLLLKVETEGVQALGANRMKVCVAVVTPGKPPSE